MDSLPEVWILFVREITVNDHHVSTICFFGKVSALIATLKRNA